MKDSQLPIPELQGVSRIHRLMHYPAMMIIIQLALWFSSMFALKVIIIKPLPGWLIEDESVRVNIRGLLILSAISGGVLTCMAYLLARNLWLPIGLHAGWNFTQVIWGMPVSGEDRFGAYALAIVDGPNWRTGGPVGVEGSVVGILLVILASSVMFWQARRKGKLVAYQAKTIRRVVPPCPFLRTVHKLTRVKAGSVTRL